jgi:lysine 6-dehydrogenase
MRILVLGAGLVGGAIAGDLAREADFSVAAVDMNGEALAKLNEKTGVTGIRADLRESGIVHSLVADYDLIVSAVPGFMGFETLKRIIEAGKDVVDISFFGEDPFLLDDLARSKGITAVVDCGVAPGLCNIIAGYIYGQLDRMERYVCYVGGLPIVREWPFEYKAVFSPLDVLAEYVRPARFIENGREVVRPALSDVELIDFPGIGVLEAFNTDGLHTLGRTLEVPFMSEKTLRYPGHADLMRVFRETGFFDEEPVEIEGRHIKPIALTSNLFFNQWRLKEGEADFTVMRVVVDGEKEGKWIRYTYHLLDRYDEKTRTTSMARTTGYTCAIVARQLIRGMFGHRGICPPEFIGRVEACYRNLLKEYEKRGIHITQTITELGTAPDRTHEE